jgi:hypothetical protein
MARLTFGKLAVGDLYRYIRGGMVFRKVSDGWSVLAGSSDRRPEYETSFTEVYRVR